MQQISTTHPLQVDHEHTDHVPGSIGVERKEWYAQATMTADTVIVSVTARNPRRALDEIVASDDPLDRKPRQDLGYKYVLLRWQNDVVGGLESA